MTVLEELTKLAPGTQILVGGNRFITVDAELAASFRPGDMLRVVPTSGELLHIPSSVQRLVTSTVDRSLAAFSKMGNVSDEQISAFFQKFAEHLADDRIWQQIQTVNQSDVARARDAGRSTTRLVASDKMREGMVSGLRGWSTASSMRGKLIERVTHDGWHVDLLGAELGSVGFVFEGRPNVVADATGVLRGGNTVVFRIGRDALETARAIVELATRPALQASNMPRDAVSLVESPERAAGWALFSDPRLSLAVARGSGPAVATLGGLAQQAGVPVSLHGTGGAWLVASDSADPDALEQAVFESLDRKVCNTLNTACLALTAQERLIPAFLAGLRRAGERRGQAFKLHVTEAHLGSLPKPLLQQTVNVRRASGEVSEKQVEALAEAELGREWEWEETPEVSLTLVKNTQQAVELCNRYSPNFVACLLSNTPEEHEAFYRTVNAPFVGDGFTRWVDGQFALRRPELGLSNWQNGRLFGRGGVLSGDSVYTVRTRRTVQR